MKSNHSKSSGFTLLEILLVVGIIAILAGIVIIAINPSKQLAQVRNTERKSDIKQLDSAITQYYIDTFDYPSDITTTLTEVCNTGSVSSTTNSIYGNPCTNLINLSSLVPDYITAIPVDPQSTSSYDGTGYYVKEDSTTHKLITQATLAELSQTISIGVVGSEDVVSYDWDSADLSGTSLSNGGFPMWGGAGNGVFDYAGVQTFSLYFGGSVTGYSYTRESEGDNWLILIDNVDTNNMYIGLGAGAFLFKDNLTWGGDFDGNNTSGTNGSDTTNPDVASISWNVAPVGW